MMWSRTSFKPGMTHRDTWFGGPIGSRVSPLHKLATATATHREGDWIYLNSMRWTTSPDTAVGTLVVAE